MNGMVQLGDHERAYINSCFCRFGGSGGAFIPVSSDGFNGEPTVILENFGLNMGKWLYYVN